MFFGLKGVAGRRFFKIGMGAPPKVRWPVFLARFSAGFDNPAPTRSGVLRLFRSGAAAAACVAPIATHPSRRAQRQYNACSGNAELKCTQTRRTLTVTLAATFKSRGRIVPTVACASWVPCNPTLRKRSNRRYARVASQSRNWLLPR